MIIKEGKKGPLLPFLVILFFLSLFVFKGVLFLDPDFGWRVVAGESFLKRGIPKTDLFSYTMPSFPWVDHAWSLSVLIYLIYSTTGFLGLSVLFSLVALASLLISAKRVKAQLENPKLFEKIALVLDGRRIPLFVYLPLNFKYLSYFVSLPVILSTSILFTFFGVRVQVFSWLMVSIILYIFFSEKVWQRWKFVLPILFLVWANLHGSFAVGIEAFFLFLLLRAIRLRKVFLVDWFYFFVSLLATFLNPYGIGVWREVWSSVSDSSLRWRIAEWMPALTMLDLTIPTFIAFSGGLLFKYRKKFSLEEKGVFILFLLQAIASRRHLPLWTITALPISCKGIYYVWLEAKKVKEGVDRFNKIYEIGFLFVSALFFIQAFFAIQEANFLGKGNFYPKGAVNYLSGKVPNGQIFSEYGWGGYLIWKLPQKKVFIDGRMPSWRKKPLKEGELESAFDAYEEILKGKIDYKEVFRKFDIDTVLWSNPKEKTPLDELFEKIERFLQVFGWKPNKFDFLETLEADGWIKEYQDKAAVIYKKPY